MSLPFTYLIYLLATIGAVVVLLSIVLAAAYLTMARRLAHGLRQTVERMERQLIANLAVPDARTDNLGKATVVVPPMRIHVESKSPLVKRLVDPLTERIDNWLHRHSFESVGDFVIEELGGEQLRLFLSDDRCLIAAIRRPADVVEPYVEFCIELGQGQRGGVSNPPRGTLELPPGAVGSYHSGRLSDNFELLSRMWLEIKEIVDHHAVVPFEPSRVPEYFEEAHACEMESRLKRGGLTEDEIRAAFRSQGVVASERDVAEIQEQWQIAIERHLLDFSSRAQNHYYAGGHILIVHNGSLRSYILGRILEMLNGVDSSVGLSRDELLAKVTELRILLNRFSPREAVARFRPLLPAPIRYNLVDQLHQPVEADLYLL